MNSPTRQLDSGLIRRIVQMPLSHSNVLSDDKKKKYREIRDEKRTYKKMLQLTNLYVHSKTVETQNRNSLRQL